MTLHSQIIILSLWCAQPTLQSVVAAILWRRKLHKQFPVFFLYLVAQVANFAIIFPLWLTRAGTAYFWLFWLGEAVTAVLGFKVIHEIFLDVFRPYHTLKDLGTLLFKWAGVVMLLVSVVVAFSSSFGPESDDERHDHAAALGAHRAGWAHPLFAAVFELSGSVAEADQFWDLVGLGLSGGVELMLLALNSGGLVRHENFDLINMLTYDFAILVWLGYSFSRTAGREALRQPIADPALGAGFGGSSTRGSFRFADPNVRRHGGARVLAKFESGSKRPIIWSKRPIICRSTAPASRSEPTLRQPVPTRDHSPRSPKKWRS